MDAAALLELVTNPDKYKAMVADLQDRQKALDASIAVVGTISEINELKAKAEKALVKANKEAEKVLNEAVEKAEAIVADAKKVSEEAYAQKASVQAREAVAKADKAQAQETIKSYEDKVKAVEKAQARIDALYKELSDKELELNERLAKLRSVMA